MSASLHREALATEASALLELATERLVEASAVGHAEDGDWSYTDIYDELANLLTLVRWQCEAPDLKAIEASCKPLHRAQLQREAEHKAKS